MEMWYNVASNGSKVIMGGLDVNNGQSAHQCYNWSMFDYNSTTLDWSKTWQSNNGNGVRGDGVCITNDATPKIFAGYSDDPLQQHGIMQLSASDGSPTQYVKLHYGVNDFDDVNIELLDTDGTNIYYAGWTTAITGGSQITYLIGCMDIATMTTQWTNTLTRTSNETCAIHKIRYNPGTDKIDISGNTSASIDGTNTGFILELPKDGSGTGQYGLLTYSATSLNSSAGTSSWYSGSPSFSDYTSTTTIEGSAETDSNDLVSWQLKSDYGHDEFIVPGSYSWECPAGVTSVCVVAVGAGGSGTADGGPGGGGGGGGLGWKNNITVTPGTSYTVVVGDKGNIGANGGNSYFIDTNTVCGFGGSGNGNTGTGGNGGSYTGDGGGSGGAGGSITNANGGYELVAVALVDILEMVEMVEVVMELQLLITLVVVQMALVALAAVVVMVVVILVVV